jgi:hypothetical protein
LLSPALLSPALPPPYCCCSAAAVFVSYALVSLTDAVLYTNLDIRRLACCCSAAVVFVSYALVSITMLCCTPI